MVKASTAMYVRPPTTVLVFSLCSAMVGFLDAPAPPTMQAPVLSEAALHHSTTHLLHWILTALTLLFDNQLLPKREQNFHPAVDVMGYSLPFVVQAEACYANDWRASPGAYYCESAERQIVQAT